MDNLTTEQDLTNEEMEELVQMIMALDGQDHYTKVLKIWSKYIKMVFDQERTKDKQASNIRSALVEHKALVKERAAKTPPKERNMRDAAEIMAMDFIHPVVSQAFDFSTYSGAKRCTYIRNAIQVEIDAVEAKVNPLRHILDEFMGGEDSNE